MKVPIKHGLLTGAAIIGFLPCAAFAQAAGAPSATAAEEADAGNSGDIIVTAQRRGERLSQVPVSVAVQTAETLGQANIGTLRELTLVTPGLNFTASGPYSQPTIRGQSVDAATIGNESNVAIYVDGVYQPVQQANFFELADVSQIEVLKGPQGTLFGRNASAGAIQIFTRDPSFTAEGLVSVTGSFYDTRGMELGTKGFVTTPLSSTVAMSVSGYYTHSSGYYHDVLLDRKAGKVNSGLIRGKLLFQPSDGIKFVLTGYYSSRKDESTYAFFPLSPPPAAVAGVHATKPYEIAVNELGYSKIESWGASLRGEIDIAGGTLSTVTAYSRLESDQIADGDATKLPIQTYLLSTPNRTFQQEAIYASPKWDAFDFVLGAFYFNSVDRYDPLEVGNTVATPFVSIYAKSKTDAIAGFGEVNVRPLQDLTLTAGIRYSSEKRTYDGGFGTTTLTRIGQKTFKAWTPRFSARYEFAPGSNVYFTYSQGFKSGLFDATSFSPVPYEPEKVKAYELGIKTALGSSIDFTAAIFRNDVKDRQVTANGPNSLPIISNAAAARIDGGEISLNWRSDMGLSINAAASWLPTAKYTSYPGAVVQAPDPVNGGSVNSVQDLSGSRVQKTPEFQASLLVNYETELASGAKLGVSANAAYSSKFFYTVGGYIEQPDYAIINTSISWTSPSDTFKVTAFVKNLTNKAVLQNFVNFGVAYQPPRQIGITGEIKF